MASTSKQGFARQLSELLEEKQEPFVLEIYLLERGCKRKGLELQGKDGFFSTKNNKNNNNLSKLLKRSSMTSFKSSGQFSNMARNVYETVVSINKVLGLKNSNHRARKNDKGAVSSSATSSNTCSENDTERESMSSPAKNANHETAPDRVMTQWRLGEENKQCSPVSVLDEIDFLQVIPVYNVMQEEVTSSASKIKLQKNVHKDSILSASLWELLVQSQKEKTKQPRSELLPQYMNSKRSLQQTKQLLFDCVREVVESQNGKQQRKMRRKQKGLMGVEEIGKIISNNLKEWGKLSVERANINQLLSMDLILGSTEEWGGLETCSREIALEIGDGILEDITDEIVRDMDDQF